MVISLCNESLTCCVWQLFAIEKIVGVQCTAASDLVHSCFVNAHVCVCVCVLSIIVQCLCTCTCILSLMVAIIIHDSSVAVCTLLGDPYDSTSILSPWLRHQLVCSKEGTPTLFMRKAIDKQHRTCTLTFHSALSELSCIYTCTHTHTHTHTHTPQMSKTSHRQ